MTHRQVEDEDHDVCAGGLGRRVRELGPDLVDQGQAGTERHPRRHDQPEHHLKAEIDQRFGGKRGGPFITTGGKGGGEDDGKTAQRCCFRYTDQRGDSSPTSNSMAGIGDAREHVSEGRGKGGKSFLKKWGTVGQHVGVACRTWQS